MTGRTKHDLSGTIAFYDRMLDDGDDDRRRVGWQTSFAQDVAFLSLARVEGLASGARVLDVGCGLGALKAFFDRAGLAVDYTGVDVNPRMIEGAKARHPGTRFEVRDILQDPPAERFDFVLCSGALSHRVANHQRYMKDMVETMYGLADVALAFNLLSAWGFMASPTLQRDAIDGDHAWPEDILRACKRMAAYVTVAHDMVRQRFDVFMYRHHRGALARYLAHVRPGTTYDREVQAVIDYHHELGLLHELRAFLGTLAPCAQVSVELGRVCLQLGDAAAAETAFAEASRLDPQHPGPHLHRGRRAAQARDHAAASEHLQRALAVDPRCVEARDLLVRCLVAAGRRTEARLALDGMPAGPLASFLAALVADDPAEQRAALERALAAAPRYLEALIRLATLREAAGEPDAARELYRRARALAPFDRGIAAKLA